MTYDRHAIMLLTTHDSRFMIYESEYLIIEDCLMEGRTARGCRLMRPLAPASLGQCVWGTGRFCQLWTRHAGPRRRALDRQCPVCIHPRLVNVTWPATWHLKPSNSGQHIDEAMQSSYCTSSLGHHPDDGPTPWAELRSCAP